MTVRKLFLSRGRAIVDPLNVSQVLAAYNASLSHVFKHKALTITGILEPKNNTPYSGKLYWYLVDGGARLTVQIPERSRDLSGRRVRSQADQPRGYGKNAENLRSPCTLRASHHWTLLRKTGSGLYDTSENGATRLGQRSSIPSRTKSSQAITHAC
jgi:hypothetical protein